MPLATATDVVGAAGTKIALKAMGGAISLANTVFSGFMGGSASSAYYQKKTTGNVSLTQTIGDGLAGAYISGITYMSGKIVQNAAQNRCAENGSGIPESAKNYDNSKAARRVVNWKGDEVKIPEGHKMSPRDPDFSAKPITEEGPYTSAQRESFLKGKSGDTKLAPHHRHQIPVRDGGVIDELPGPGHPSGNQHTAGSPNRHPAKSIFNSEPGGNTLRANEISQSWIDKGNRLIEVEPGVWIDPGF